MSLCLNNESVVESHVMFNLFLWKEEELKVCFCCNVITCCKWVRVSLVLIAI